MSRIVTFFCFEPPIFSGPRPSHLTNKYTLITECVHCVYCFFLFTDYCCMISITELPSLSVTVFQNVRIVINLYVENLIFLSPWMAFLKVLVTSDVKVNYLVTVFYCWIMCWNREDVHYVLIFIINFSVFQIISHFLVLISLLARTLLEGASPIKVRAE